MKLMSRRTRLIVVGTGRCGSNSFCAWLRRCGLVARIEPTASQLVVEQRRFVEGDGCNLGLLPSLALTTPDADAVVDNNLSFFVKLLLNHEPSLRVIWLIRNAWDCVGSMVGWKWYRDSTDIVQNDIYARNRLQAPWTSEMTWPEWKSLPAVGRCSWSWSFINRSIEQQLQAVSPSVWMKVRLEDWNDEKAREVYGFVREWFGLAGIPTREPEDLTLPHENKGPYPVVRPGETPCSKPKWTEWERCLVRRFAGGMVERHYPGWPEPTETNG